MEKVLSFPSSYKLTGMFGSILATFDFSSAKGTIKDPVAWRRLKLYYLYLEGSIQLPCPSVAC